jgi:hypothetical protein
MRDPKLLLELSAIPGFGVYLQMIRAQRPYIPAWTSEKTPDDWIYYTGLQAGFDIAMNFFDEGDSE